MSPVHGILGISEPRLVEYMDEELMAAGIGSGQLSTLSVHIHKAFQNLTVA